MSKTAVIIGPKDQGRRMNLDEFGSAEAREGHLYELGRGVVTVVDVPNRKHLAEVTAARRQLVAYDLAHPGRIHTVAAGSECKILLADLQSERHPDLAVYKSPPSDEQTSERDDDLWATWIPEIVIEVVSPGSEHRDYVDKREEYLQFGVREYWIIDGARQQMLVLRRSGGRWVERVINRNETYRTRQLPGFELFLGSIFEASDAVRGS